MDDPPNSHQESVIVGIVRDETPVLKDHQVPVTVPAPSGEDDHTAVCGPHRRPDVDREINAGMIARKTLGQYALDGPAARCAAFPVRGIGRQGRWRYRLGPNDGER